MPNDEFVTVFGVYKNDDMTEGRGPMVLDTLFFDKEVARTYANSQQGVMGRPAFRDHARIRKSVANPTSKWDEPCTGWECKVCGPRRDWLIREHRVYGHLPVSTEAVN